MAGSRAHDRARRGPGAETRRTRHDTAPPAPRVTDDAPASGMPLAAFELSPREVMALQRTVGNRAVAAIMPSVAQRVAIQEGSSTETLYNKVDKTTGQATAHQYGGTTSYDMTRDGDNGVTVTVRIRFLSQKRNSVDPSLEDSPEGTPELGALLGDPEEIPESDPRRAWATDVATGGVAHWNGHLTLVGEEWNLTEENTQKRLPMTFKSVPVFGLEDEADSQIIVHPSSVVAGTPGQPIDAGNYYMNKGAYGADEKIIAAHEYGHLLGINDEYSQSNEQLNALLHQAAPDTAASAGAYLDRATVRRMVLAALRRPLVAQLGATMSEITDAIQAQRAVIKAKMAAAAQVGVVSPAVRAQLGAQLAGASDESIEAGVPGAVAFETTSNFSNITLANEGVEWGFSSDNLSQHIINAYRAAIDAPVGETVNVAGLGDVSIEVQKSVTDTTAAGGAQEETAAALATSTVGDEAAPGLPAIAPSGNLTERLVALPATWTVAGGAIETGITPANFADKMVATLQNAAAAETAAAAALPPGTAAEPKMQGSRALYARAYQMVTYGARNAAAQVAWEVMASTVDPVLADSVADLQVSITDEVMRIMTTPAAGIAALGTPDPNMVAMVAAMKARLDADKAATAGGGRDPLGPKGATAAAQDVTYSYQGLMGENATTELRPDQFAPMVKQFNSKLTTLFEKQFTAEVK